MFVFLFQLVNFFSSLFTKNIRLKPIKQLYLSSLSKLFISLKMKTFLKLRQTSKFIIKSN